MKAYTKHVVHEGTSAGANLYELNTLARPALAHPFGDEPDAEKLAKYLGDFGRGDKVSFGAKLVAALSNGSGVVASQVTGQTHAHVTGQGDGAGSLEEEELVSYNGDELSVVS